MIELTDAMKEKLNDPKVIKGISEFVLINFGKMQHELDIDERGNLYNSLFCDFYDFLENPMVITGRFDLGYSGPEIKINNEVYNFFHRQSNKEVVHKIVKANNNFIFKLDKKNFPVLEIFSYNSDNIVKDFFEVVPKKVVFSEFNYELNRFEKGDWQERLAQIYLTGLKFVESKDNLLL